MGSIYLFQEKKLTRSSEELLVVVLLRVYPVPETDQVYGGQVDTPLSTWRVIECPGSMVTPLGTIIGFAPVHSQLASCLYSPVSVGGNITGHSPANEWLMKTVEKIIGMNNRIVTFKIFLIRILSSSNAIEFCIQRHTMCLQLNHIEFTVYL